MAGYRHVSKTYKLTFEDYPGLVIETKSISTGQMTALMAMAAQLSDKNVSDRSKLTEKDVEAVDALFSGFAQALKSWNLEDEDGNPVPATEEGVNSTDFEFIFSLIDTWIEAVVGTPGDLGKGSNSGPQFPEGSLPMAPLSLNLPS